MIVVIGQPAATPSARTGIGGLAGRVAVAAASRGAEIQLVGKVGDDAIGDALVLALGAAGVGHVAILRDAAHATTVEAIRPDEPVDLLAPDRADPADATAAAPEPSAGSGAAPGSPALEPADLELALRYLTAYEVVVLTDPLDAAAIATVVAAVDFAGAKLVLVGPPAPDAPAGPDGPAEPALPADATVLDPPPGGDPDGAFADMLAAYAVALDAGSAPVEALRAARAAVAAD
jgi:ribokinase